MHESINSEPTGSDTPSSSWTLNSVAAEKATIFFNTVVCQKVPYLSLKIPHQFYFPKGPYNKDFCWDKVEILQTSSHPLSNWMYIMKTSWGFQEIVLLVMKRPQTLNIDFKCQNMCWCVNMYSQNRYIRRNYKILVIKEKLIMTKRNWKDLITKTLKAFYQHMFV